MKIEGRIIAITRDENTETDGGKRVYSSARVAMSDPEALLKTSEIKLFGYEPAVTFKIGQRVMITLVES